MKLLGLPLIMLLCTLTGVAKGLGGRGAAEKVMYWYAYLCEEEAGPPYTVAPGCADMMNGGKRCNLLQFLRYIWNPSAQLDETARPPTTELPPVKNPARYDNPKAINQLYNMIADSPYRDWINPRRLIGVEDYYTATRLTGAAIGNAEARMAKPSKLFERAKEAARVSYIMRFKDMEAYRISRKMLAKAEYLGREPETRTVKTGVSSPPSFKALDAQATLNKYASVPNFAAHFEDACRRYRADDADHFMALASAADALAGSGCEVPPVDGRI